MKYFFAFSPLVCFVFNLLVQIVLFRKWRGLGLLRSEYVGFAAGFVGILTINSVQLYTTRSMEWVDTVGFFILTVTTYSALGYCYFHFVNLGETARRIRLMRELFDAGGKLSFASLLASYPVEEILAKRIERLTGTRQIILREGYYYIGNPVMLMIASIIVAFKVILLGKGSKHGQ